MCRSGMFQSAVYVVSWVWYSAQNCLSDSYGPIGPGAQALLATRAWQSRGVPCVDCALVRLCDYCGQGVPSALERPGKSAGGEARLQFSQYWRKVLGMGHAFRFREAWDEHFGCDRHLTLERLCVCPLAIAGWRESAKMVLFSGTIHDENPS